MNANRVAHIWPGRPAMEQALAGEVEAAPGRVLLLGRHFSQDNFLPAAMEAMSPAGGGRQLDGLSGPLLVGRLLHESAAGGGAFEGLRRGWRLPARLWRLLVELKAGGLDPARVRRVGGERCIALAELLNAYDQALAGLGLADQADQLRRLEAASPAEAPWDGVIFHDVLWLRAMDLRLIQLLQGRAVVEVRFCLPPPAPDRRGLAKLLRVTAAVLESGPGGNIDIVWRHPWAAEGLAGLADALLNPGGAPLAQAPDGLDIVRAAGRYGEVEALLARAEACLERGVAPGDICLAFPDLSLYGQLAADIAGRRGLPLAAPSNGTLAAVPLINDILAMLALPGGGWPRDELADVLEHPVLGAAWQAPAGARRGLLASGYIDGLERPASAGLGGEGGLADACRALEGALAGFTKDQAIPGFCRAVVGLLQGMGLPGLLVRGPGGAALKSGELMALVRLERVLGELEQAAELTGWNTALSPGRLLSLLQQCLDAAPAPGGRAPGGGMALLRFDEAVGVRFPVVLAGGLAQGEFPRRVQSAGLLSSAEREALGQAAGKRPIWRTEDEEYGGQMMALSWLLSQAEVAVLACPAANSAGAELEPAPVLREASRLSGLEPRWLGGSVYGSVPPLAQCADAPSLVAGLARSLRRGEDPLAPAVARQLAAAPGWGQRWPLVELRAAEEAARQALDLLPAEERGAAADAFGGVISAPRGRGLLAELMARPERRTLSPTQMESFAACPMSWFFGRILGVAQPDEPGWGLSGRDEGQLVHEVLARFFLPEDFNPAWDEAARARRLADCLDAVFGHGGPGHPLARQARRICLEDMLGAVVEAQWPLFRGGYLPWAVEQGIPREGPGALSFAAPDGGEPLALEGRLDRLDLSIGGGKTLLRIVDYKHTGNDDAVNKMSKRDLWLEHFLQLPVYMCAALGLRPEAQAVQGVIVCTRKAAAKLTPVELEPGDALFGLADQPGSLGHAVIAMWSAMAGGNYAARPSKDACQYCPHAAACRAAQPPAAEFGDQP